MLDMSMLAKTVIMPIRCKLFNVYIVYVYKSNLIEIRENCEIVNRFKTNQAKMTHDTKCIAQCLLLTLYIVLKNKYRCEMHALVTFQ